MLRRSVLLISVISAVLCEFGEREGAVEALGNGVDPVARTVPEEALVPPPGSAGVRSHKVRCEKWRWLPLNLGNPPPQQQSPQPPQYPLDTGRSTRWRDAHWPLLRDAELPSYYTEHELRSLGRDVKTGEQQPISFLANPKARSAIHSACGGGAVHAFGDPRSYAAPFFCCLGASHDGGDGMFWHEGFCSERSQTSQQRPGGPLTLIRDDGTTAATTYQWSTVCTACHCSTYNHDSVALPTTVADAKARCENTVGCTGIAWGPRGFDMIKGPGSSFQHSGPDGFGPPVKTASAAHRPDSTGWACYKLAAASSVPRAEGRDRSARAAELPRRGGPMTWGDNGSAHMFTRRYAGWEGDGLQRHSIAGLLHALGNRTLAYAGDSVTAQIASATECAWLRSGRQANAGAREGARFETVHRRVHERHKRTGNATYPGLEEKLGWPYGASYIKERHVRGAPAAPAAPAAPRATFLDYLMYRPYPDMTELRELCARSDVLVVNWGVHYLYSARFGWYEYRDEMLAVLRELQRCSRAHPAKTVIWRETTAQHHHSFSGEYPHVPVRDLESMGAPGALWGLSKKEVARARSAWRLSTNKCMPVRFAHSVGAAGAQSGAHGPGHIPEQWRAPHQWRDKIVRRIATDLKLPVRLTNWTRDMDGHIDHDVVHAERAQHGLLYWVPFQAASGERWELHGVTPAELSLHGKPEHPKPATCEPTHFCHTPLLWEPLWDGIARAIRFNNRIFGREGGERGSVPASPGTARQANGNRVKRDAAKEGLGNLWADLVGRRRRCMLAGAHPPCREPRLAAAKRSQSCGEALRATRCVRPGQVLEGCKTCAQNNVQVLFQACGTIERLVTACKKAVR